MKVNITPNCSRWHRWDLYAACQVFRITEDVEEEIKWKQITLSQSLKWFLMYLILLKEENNHIRSGYRYKFYRQLPSVKRDVYY